MMSAASPLFSGVVMESHPPFQPATSTSVDWRGIASYLAICFGLTWTIEITALIRGVHFSNLTAAVSLLLAGVMLIPALSAFVVRRWITRQGFATAGLRFGPLRPYLCILAGVPFLFALIYALTCLLKLGSFSASSASIFKALPPLPPGAHLPSAPVLIVLAAVSSLTTGPLLTTLFTFGEEFGWTGYLLPAFLPLGRKKAVVLYGVIWGLWHAPIVLGGFNYPGHPLSGVAAMCAFTTAIGLIQCFLLIRYRSVLLTSFLHAAINTQALGVWHLLVTGVSPLLGGVTGLIGIAVIATLGISLLTQLHSSGSTPQSEIRRDSPE